MSRFFNGTETTRRLLQNNTRNNSSIPETIKAIEDNDRNGVKNYDWKTYGITSAAILGGVATVMGAHTLIKYGLDRQAEQEEIPPVVEVEIQGAGGGFRL